VSAIRAEQVYVAMTSVHFRVTKTNVMYYLSSVYFVNQPLHIAGISSVCWPTDSQLKSTTRTNCCIYILPPDGGLQTCPTHVEVD